MDFLKYWRHYRVLLSCDFITFQILGQKFVKFVVGILVENDDTKRKFWNQLTFRVPTKKR